MSSVRMAEKLPLGDALREVGGYVGEDVDADQIGEAKGAGAGPADGGAGERVDFFDGEALLEHQVGGVEHDGDADAVGDEVGRVVGEDHLLAEGGGRQRRRRRRPAAGSDSAVGMTSSRRM